VVRFAPVYLGLLAIAIAGRPVSGHQNTDDPARILTLADAGKTTEAWAAWNAQSKTPAVLRLGVTLARRTKQIGRGVQVYSDLADNLRKVDRPALTELALGASDELAASPDDEARVAACAAAVALQPTHPACSQAMAALASHADSDDWAWAVFARANTGQRPRADDMGVAERAMSVPTRLRVAASMTRLTPAERVSLVRPALADAALPRRYQALLILANIPGAEARDALLYELQGQPTGQLKIAILIGLALHGHDASLAQLRPMLPSLGDYEQAQTAKALARAGDAQGRTLLLQALKSQGDGTRLDAAEAIVEFDKAAAAQVVLDQLKNGSPTILPRALALAGSLELGTDKAAYRFLADVSPLVRAAAVSAIQETFFLQDARDKARHP
jgi:HEAT repeat protein